MVLGAGASLSAPMIQAWARQFSLENKIEVRFDSVGSGEGIRRLTARVVDFAVSDVPLTPAELAYDDLLQQPLVAGAIVPVVNVPGIRAGELKLDGPTLAAIFLGNVTQWNAPEIRVLNPDLALPTIPIRVIHRADGSGSTFVFTHYLSDVSPVWAERLGIGSRLRWPVGRGARGTEGVARALQETVGGIGYLEFSAAVRLQLSTVQLRHRNGRFVAPAVDGIRRALLAASWGRPGFYEVLTNRPEDDVWPIVAVSYALLPKKAPSASDALETLKFLAWAYHRGAALASALQYGVIEDSSLIERLQSSWREIRDLEGRPVWGGN